MVSMALSARNGGRPVSSSYRIAPSPYTSLRGVGLAPGGLLGRHVAGRSHRAAAGGQGPVDRHPVGQAEVGDARAIRLVDQDVRRA